MSDTTNGASTKQAGSNNTTKMAPTTSGPAPFIKKKVMPKRSERNPNIGHNNSNTPVTNSNKDAQPSSKNQKSPSPDPSSDDDVMIIQAVGLKGLEPKTRPTTTRDSDIKNIEFTSQNSSHNSSQIVSPKITYVAQSPSAPKSPVKIDLQRKVSVSNNKPIVNIGLDSKPAPQKLHPIQPQPSFNPQCVPINEALPDDTALPKTNMNQQGLPKTPFSASSAQQPLKHANNWSYSCFGQKNPEQIVSYTNNFTWEEYLDMIPSEVAPPEAFMQSRIKLENKLEYGMKLEAKDPRNSSCWCLASVVAKEGLRCRLRFDGSDAMNDLYELIDSENIRPVGSSHVEPLLAPMNFKGNIAQYPKFVEKELMKPGTIIAQPELFPPKPKQPPRNLFKVGMKLEAVDRKHREIICPATIVKVSGDDVEITFDGWRTGAFDYKCKYYSRDLFYVNWCKETNHSIQPPNGWPKMSVSPTPGTQGDKGSRLTRGVASASKTRKSSSPPPSSAKIKTSTTTSKRCTPSPSGSSKSSLTDSARKPRGRPPKVIVKTVTVESGTDSSPEDKCDFNRFQCQRAVPYNHWKEAKQKFQQEAIEDSLESASAELPLSRHIHTVETKPSYAPQEKTKEVPTQDTNNVAKKIRLDNSEHRRADFLENMPKDVCKWSIEDVIKYVLFEEPNLSKHQEWFRDNEIDGKAFLLFELSSQTRDPNLPLGPYLKIMNIFEQLKRYQQARSLTSTLQ